MGQEKNCLGGGNKKKKKNNQERRIASHNVKNGLIFKGVGGFVEASLIWKRIDAARVKGLKIKTDHRLRQKLGRNRIHQNKGGH